MAESAVLDACVLVPISLCDVLLELADAWLYKPLWSEMILEETRRALIEKLNLPEEKADKRIAAMQQAFPTAMVSGHEGLIPAMTNHPKDRHVLATAVHAGCGLIVTANTQDFRTRALAPLRVRAMHPDSFLLGLAEDDPQAVWEAVDRKRQLFRRPTVHMAALCDRLSKTVPRFAAQLLAIDANQPVR